MNEEEVKKIWRSADAVTLDVDSTVCIDEGIDELAAFIISWTWATKWHSCERPVSSVSLRHWSVHCKSNMANCGGWGFVVPALDAGWRLTQLLMLPTHHLPTLSFRQIWTHHITSWVNNHPGPPTLGFRQIWTWHQKLGQPPPPKHFGFSCRFGLGIKSWGNVQTPPPILPTNFRFAELDSASKVWSTTPTPTLPTNFGFSQQPPTPQKKLRSHVWQCAGTILSSTSACQIHQWSAKDLQCNLIPFLTLLGHLYVHTYIPN